MHDNSHESNDLSKLERRLADWAPAADGLDADAMLFAAGRASARPGPARFLWPAVACGMMALAISLGVCLRFEHAERLALARQVQQLASAAVPESAPPPVVIPTELPMTDEEQANSYLATHRVLESGLENWPDRTVVQAEKPGPVPINPPIFQVGRPEVLLDPQ